MQRSSRNNPNPVQGLGRQAPRQISAWQPLKLARSISTSTLTSTGTPNPAKIAAQKPSLAWLTVASVLVVGGAMTYMLSNTFGAIDGKFTEANQRREQYYGSSRRH